MEISVGVERATANVAGASVKPEEETGVKVGEAEKDTEEGVAVGITSTVNVHARSVSVMHIRPSRDRGPLTCFIAFSLSTTNNGLGCTARV
jgi:hypothetical protein